MVNWKELAARVAPDPRPAIGGERIDPLQSVAEPSVNPATEEVLWDTLLADASHIDVAVAAARSAYESGPWVRDVVMRQRLLHRWADEIERRTDELALLDSLEVGIPIATTSDDVALVAEIIRFTADAPLYVNDDVLPSAPSGLSLNLWEPRGVVGIITPWNFPFFVAATKTAAALAAGNAVVVKPSELASMTTLLMADAAADAGFPPGILNVVPGTGPEAGAGLAAHPDVDFLSFTGSTGTGRILSKLSADSNLKPVLTELGGKSPQMVFRGVANLDQVASMVAHSVLWNTGQVCVAGSRLLVHEEAHEELIGHLADRFAEFAVGDPLDPRTKYGPLASPAQLDKVSGMVARAAADGAKLVHGGDRLDSPGFYFDATLFDRVAENTELFQQEVFGPVLAVTPFANLDEAIRLANATDYGLIATAWTPNMTEALAVSRRVRAGSVAINPNFPAASTHGGGFEPFGQSGSGTEGGLPGIRAYQRLKQVSLGMAPATPA